MPRRFSGLSESGNFPVGRVPFKLSTYFATSSILSLDIVWLQVGICMAGTPSAITRTMSDNCSPWSVNSSVKLGPAPPRPPGP